MQPSIFRMVITAVALLAGCGVRAWGNQDLLPLIFRTGAEVTLQQGGISFSYSSGLVPERLEFAFGFASTDVEEGGFFLDSASLLLRPSGADSTVLVTADVSGTEWVPPSNLGPPPTLTLAIQPRTFPEEWGSGYPTRVAYSVSLELPEAFRRQSLSLTLQLFDNGDRRNSLAFLDDVLATPEPPFIELRSSAFPLGPFAREWLARHDPVLRTFRIDRPDRARFFCLRSDAAVTLKLLSPGPDVCQFSYTLASPTVELLGGASVAGPFDLVTNAVMDLTNRVIRVPANQAQRFFRLNGNVRARLATPELEGETLVFRFVYSPPVFALQSSVDVCGPYADEPLTQWDPTRQILTVPLESARFYRVRSAGQPELEALPVYWEGQSLVIPYRPVAAGLNWSLSSEP